MATECTHLGHVLITELPEEVDGCAECRPGEDWACFLDELAMRIPAVQGQPRIPPSPLGG